MTAHRIISRGEWGAKHDNGAGGAPLPATEVWLHHSVTIAPDLVPPFTDDYAAVRRLEEIGEQRFGRGISYTFVITPVGLIFEGHGVDRVGTHTGGRNTRARAICFVGNYDKATPTDAQLDAAAWLLQHGKAEGWWTAARLNGGHRDVKATGCPGSRAYALIPEINSRASRPAPAPAPAVVVAPQFSPPLPVAGWCRLGNGAFAAVAPDGAVYCDPADAYKGGVNGKAYFKGRVAARIVPFGTDRYTIIATSGEEYTP